MFKESKHYINSVETIPNLLSTIFNLTQSKIMVFRWTFLLLQVDYKCFVLSAMFGPNTIDKCKFNEC